MNYTLSQIIDVDELKSLCESFSGITGTVTAILDLDGNVLIATGWQPICTQFHRMNPKTRKRCNESDTILAGKLKKGEKYNVYQCKNGLIDVAIPIMIENEHVGNFFTGQVFSKKPDIEYFRQQAKQFGFDEKKYLSALESVPVFSEAQIKKNAEFLVKLTETIGKTGLKNLKSLEQTTQLNTAKEKAEASERKLKSISDNMLDLVAVTDLQGNYKYAGASHKILGYDTDWLIEKNVMDFVHPDDLPSVQSDFISFIENRTDKAKSTYRNLCADGSYLWFETFGTFIFDENAKPIEILFNTRDITERKQAEEALKQSEEKLSLIVNESPFPIAVADINNEKIQYWSQNAVKMFGHSPATVSEWYELAYPDPEYRKQAIERWKPFLKTARESDTAINTGEYHITCKEGSIKICEIFVQYIPDNIVVTFNDVTERKKAEQALKQSEANLHFLNTMVNEAFNLKDLNSIYHYISSKLSEILPDTIILFQTIDNENEKAIFENFYGINNQLFKKLLNVMPFNPVGKEFKLMPDYREFYKTGKLVEFKKGLTDFSKGQFPSLAANTIEKILGIHKIYSIGILRGKNLLANFHLFTYNKTKITNAEFIEAFVKQAGLILQIKQAELKLEEANATKDQFVSILGHDLRSPFNSLIGLTNLLIENIEEYDIEKIKLFVKTIRKTSRQTFNLLENLLEWSRSQRNKIPFNPQTTNLYSLVYESYKLLHESAKAKQINIELDVVEDIEANVDIEMIKTVIRNLLSNAIKFTPEDGTINISASQNQNFVQIEISDTGIGMDSETLNSLFKVGKTISMPGTEDEQGTGFGLLLCKEFIDKHGEEIWAESEIGKGSDFKFTVPRKLETTD